MTKDLRKSVDCIHDAKSVAENKILEIIKDFEGLTGLHVDSIELRTSTAVGLGNFTVDAIMSVSL